jgi:GMP synthase (glutamine-hydrolysing)
VITGSPASLTRPEPWMEVGVELVRDAHHQGTPLLGVCFGHQMIGAAFGGHVIENPNGWALSTYEVEITETGRADPLFDGIPDVFDVNLSHRDIIHSETLSPMNGVRVLAGNAKAEVQAVAAGDAIRGVQFHPEFSGAITRSYQEIRHQTLADDADARGAEHEHPDRLTERTRDCPHAEAVFTNFIRHFVLES